MTSDLNPPPFITNQKLYFLNSLEGFQSDKNAVKALSCEGTSVEDCVDPVATETLKASIGECIGRCQTSSVDQKCNLVLFEHDGSDCKLLQMNTTELTAGCKKAGATKSCQRMPRHCVIFQFYIATLTWPSYSSVIIKNGKVAHS